MKTSTICWLIIFVYVLMTIQRNATWATEELLWKDVVAKSPNKPSGHLSLGRFYASVGNYSKAIEEYQLAMKLANERGTFRDRDQLMLAQSNLGEMFLKLNELKMAETLFRATLSLRPDFGPAAVNLSNVLINDHRDTEAMTILDNALLGNAKSLSEGKLYQNKGIALCNLGYVSQSNLNFQKAVTLDADLEPLACGEGF